MSNVEDITGEIVDCPRCGEPAAQFSAITVAIVVVLAVILVYYLVSLGVAVVRRAREGFVTPQAYEVTAKSRELFEKSQGNASYSDYKTSIVGSDPVVYTDVKALWKDGKLTPSNVQEVL